MIKNEELSDLTVAVVSGAVSEEDATYLRESDQTGSSLFAILHSLERSGVRAFHLDPTHPDFINNVRKVDVAFLNVHGPYGEDGRIQGLLDYISVPYVNSGVCASAVGMDKLVTKAVFHHLGTPTPSATPAVDHQEIESIVEVVGFPCMLKASASGSSIGIELINGRGELAAATQRIRQRGFERLFLEGFIEGRPMTVSVVETNGKPLALPVVETVTERPFYDELAKLKGGDDSQTWYRSPVGVSESTLKGMRDHSERVFEFLDCRGAVRVDFMVQGGGEFFALEINTSPGLQPHGNLPMAAAMHGIDYDDLILTLLGAAADRGNRVPWKVVG